MSEYLGKYGNNPEALKYISTCGKSENRFNLPLVKICPYVTGKTNERNRNISVRKIKHALN